MNSISMVSDERHIEGVIVIALSVDNPDQRDRRGCMDHNGTGSFFRF